nr:acyltransferase [Acaryochloris sp. 'Moss Beach']
MNDYTYISSIYGVTIGNNTRIGEFVSIRDNDHQFSQLDIPICSQGFLGAPVEIGNDVWIGRGVFIGKGIHIGNGAIVGANSVVTKNIPPYAVAVGVPAKVIKYRKYNDEHMESYA